MANLKWSEAYKGEYNSETSYVIGNFVTYNGSCYTCIANSTGNLPTNTSYWKLVSSKGDTGPQGIQGPQGEKGDKGDPGGPQGEKGDKGDPGDVSGPASSTDNAIVLFNGTTGGVIKDSGKTLPSGDVVGTTDTQTLTNKKINPRQSSTTSTSSLTPDKANYDEYYVTALSENITINNATSPSVGNTFVIYLTDDGTSARTISFGNHYAGIGSALPTTTTKGKTMEIIIKYVTDSIALVSYSEKV